MANMRHVLHNSSVVDSERERDLFLQVEEFDKQRLIGKDGGGGGGGWNVAVL